MSDWSYNQIAALYDEDMGRSMQLDDLAGYRHLLPSPPSSILEVGCGTGRLTLPLIESGYRVCSVDRSLAMLKQLWRNAAAYRARLQLINLDARRMFLRQRFDAVLFAYCGFQYLIGDAEIRAFFKSARQVLKHRGILILDVFLHSDDIVTDAWCCDYRRQMADGRTLERWKHVELLSDGTNRVERCYIIDDHERDSVYTVSRQRLYTAEQLCDLVRGYGFKIVAHLYDYQFESGVDRHPHFYTIALTTSKSLSEK